ncbi:hypothetical protein OSH11_04190 [Kaistia dalseonensis]|uniref:Uncharacterized protein n=1 Tax=Kaistia dalseonensis TaxID=410840 RepID=A0ABU0H2C6_9HYPH|nr:hypothetical protein [Kaistia dalseonensis]MCX5493893.1 hypothetical protein [Kaistia dalseonensis]MDQ0436459.1 hypothetical protein [Kaistia dalseonensis]
MFSSAPGTYRVVSVLPESAGRLQYRIKSELERHERVVDESQLHAVSERA